MTEKPFNPTTMKIVAKTSDTKTGAPSVVPPAIQGIRDCQRLVSEGKAEKSNCASLASVLETVKERGMTVVQCGISSDGNALFVAVNLKSGEGSIYESTTVGATVDKLPFASGKIY
ncbi:hypothetical protein [Pseudomonas sp. NA-150]|uniref:hypothetical protein n=1 Tax=Pseudomonas sp. NA-150 TaxID=3367525 RepID=UPI0037CC45AA